MASGLGGIGFFLLHLCHPFQLHLLEILLPFGRVIRERLYYPLEGGAGSSEERMTQRSAWASVCCGSDLPSGPKHSQASALRNGTGGQASAAEPVRFSGYLEA